MTRFTDLKCGTIFCNAMYNTSDPNDKTDIEPLTDEDAHQLFERLKPYKYKIGDDPHYGVMLSDCPDEICKNNKVDYNSVLAILLGEMKYQQHKNGRSTHEDV